MFGLPESNEHEYEIGTIGDVVKDVHYGTAKKASEDGRYIYIRMNNITYDGELDLTDIKHIDVPEKDLAGCMVQEGDVLFNRTNSKDLVGKTCHFTGDEPMIIAGYIIRLRMNGKVLPEYVSTFMNLERSKKLLYSMAKGAVGQANINAKEVQAIPIVIPPESVQQEFLKLRKQSDKSKFTGFKSQFIEEFGDPVDNPMDWPMRKLSDVAKVDGTMTKEYEKYADYPHIGIDSIEKNTGILSGYRTVKEDNVISPKYYFGPHHILYSKIRPALNKVALPDFEGLCSADCYPLLITGMCDRKFLAHVMRSDYFLDYVLSYSGRSQMPKVNRKQLEGFSFPCPPIELQEKFTVLIDQSDKSK